jgi:hypothetical protein
MYFENVAQNNNYTLVDTRVNSKCHRPTRESKKSWDHFIFVSFGEEKLLRVRAPIISMYMLDPYSYVCMYVCTNEIPLCRM